MPMASYRCLQEKGFLGERTARALGMLENCRLCPRKCGAARSRGERGFCRTGRYARLASHGPHFGEEAPLVGIHGSGTIFFSCCNLYCSFCQNWDISHGGEGAEAGPDELAGMMLELEERGCHNINLVTPSHVVPQILEAVSAAAGAGLSIPLVFNTGGYDTVETLQLLEGVIDVYMPDFKFWDAAPATAFCSAPDFREVACRALREMHRQVGDLVVDGRGIAVRGLLVRHLVMPEGLAGTEDVMGFLAREISPRTWVNVMDQYRPCYRAGEDPRIGRRITRAEFDGAMEAARRSGLRRLGSGEG